MRYVKFLSTYAQSVDNFRLILYFPGIDIRFSVNNCQTILSCNIKKFLYYCTKNISFLRAHKEKENLWNILLICSIKWLLPA